MLEPKRITMDELNEIIDKAAKDGTLDGWTLHGCKGYLKATILWRNQRLNIPTTYIVSESTQEQIDAANTSPPTPYVQQVQPKASVAEKTTTVVAEATPGICKCNIFQVWNHGHDPDCPERTR